MSTPRIAEDCPSEALERLTGSDHDRALVMHALAERDTLIRELHRFRQDHRATAAELIHDASMRIERAVEYLKKYDSQEGHDHG